MYLHPFDRVHITEVGLAQIVKVARVRALVGGRGGRREHIDVFGQESREHRTAFTGLHVENEFREAFLLVHLDEGIDQVCKSHTRMTLHRVLVEFACFSGIAFEARPKEDRKKLTGRIQIVIRESHETLRSMIGEENEDIILGSRVNDLFENKN